MSEEITPSDSKKYYKFGNIVSHVCQISFGPVVIEDVKLIRSLWSALLQFEIRIDRGDPINMRMAHEVASSLDINVNEMKSYDERRRCFEAALVLYLSTREEVLKLQWTDTSIFLKAYPEFLLIKDTKELELLLYFRNITKISLALLPHRNKKTYIIDLVSKIAEAKFPEAKFGSDRSSSKNRIIIFEKEKREIQEIKSDSNLSLRVTNIEGNTSNSNQDMHLRSIYDVHTNENSDISNLNSSMNSNDGYQSIVEVDPSNENTPNLNNYNTEMHPCNDSNSNDGDGDGDGGGGGGAYNYLLSNGHHPSADLENSSIQSSMENIFQALNDDIEYSQFLPMEQELPNHVS